MSMTKRFVMKNLFYFPKVLGSGRIQVSSDTNRMELKYACPKRNLKGKSLLVLKNKRTSGFVKERFRCHKFGFEDMVILIACGLHNFRISHKMSHITN